MRAVRETHPDFPSDRILEMATVNGARALGQEHALGKIRSGFLADLIALPLVNPSNDLFTEIISWDKSVPWVMLAGDLMEQG